MLLRIEHLEALEFIRHEAMATEFVFGLGGVDSAYARQAASEAFRVIDDVEGKLSLYRESSDISRINLAKAGVEIRVSEACIDCLETALLASSLTSGRFNVFVGAEACRAKGNVPSHLISQAAVGPAPDRVVSIDAKSRSIARLANGPTLDLGGVGKGFALQRAAQALEEWEIPLMMLNAGGSTLLFRAVEGVEPWQAELAPFGRLRFGNAALSSSGLGFESEHIIDPTTQKPGTLWTRSYVQAEDAGLADALSTGCMLLEWDRIERMVMGEEALAAAVFDGDGAGRMRGGFFERFA